MTDDNRKALRGAITNMPDMELPENMRVPLHSLRADTGYLFGRTAADGSVAGMMQQAADNYLSQIEEAAYRMMGEAECLRTALAASEAKVMKAREALMPFAWMAEHNISAHGNTEAMRYTLGDNCCVVTWDRFRNAATTLKDIA